MPLSQLFTQCMNCYFVLSALRSMHLRTSEFAANVKLLTCMLRKTVACFVWPWASADLSSVSCSTCKTLSEYCGLSKPKSYALQVLAALCWASNKAASEESTPGIAISVLYNLVDCTPVRFVIYCVTNMRRTAETSTRNSCSKRDARAQVT